MPAQATTPARRPASRNALSILGAALLGFFSLVFLLGRHAHWQQIYEDVIHPFDPHPEGIHRTGNSSSKPGAISRAQVDAKPPSPAPSLNATAAATKVEPTQTQLVNSTQTVAATKKAPVDGLTQLDRDYTPTR